MMKGFGSAKGESTSRGVPPVGARSFWLEEALRADPGAECPALAGPVTADVCVVGGGFAGLWTAYELTERAPQLGVVLLEGDICGAGGSGANGGFFSPSWTGLLQQHRGADIVEAGQAPSPRGVQLPNGSVLGP